MKKYRNFWDEKAQEKERVMLNSVLVTKAELEKLDRDHEDLELVKDIIAVTMITICVGLLVYAINIAADVTAMMLR